MDYKENLDYTVSRIREWREKHKWSIQELADRADIHRSEMSKIEKGRRNVTFRTMCRIAEALEVNLGDLVR